MLHLSLTAILRLKSLEQRKKPALGTNFATAYTMPQIIVYDIIQSERAKTIEQASAIIKHLRSVSKKNDELVLDFSKINWITSMFADRLIGALATFYGSDFEKKLNVTGIEKTNVMFDTLWESAIEKFRFEHGSLAEA